MILILMKVRKFEMFKTHGCNKNLRKNFKNLKFTSINRGLKKTIESWI